MGQNNYSDGGLDDEPHNILSVDGKRLKSKMDLLAKRSYLNVPRFSEVTTPGKSERDTDGEIYTVIQNTFKIKIINIKIFSQVVEDLL